MATPKISDRPQPVNSPLHARCTCGQRWLVHAEEALDEFDQHIRAVADALHRADAHIGAAIERLERLSVLGDPELAAAARGSMYRMLPIREGIERFFHPRFERTPGIVLHERRRALNAELAP